MRLQSGALDITIPNAQLGNTDSVNPNAIVRENRGLAPITFKAPEWPVNTTKKFSIKTMTRTEHDDILDFLIQTAGLQITLTDHNDAVWTGIVVTQVPEFITIQDGCSYDIEFEFLRST
jgi:hypothetical protein